jgi:methylglutaconyl-CoA hydratase
MELTTARIVVPAVLSAASASALTDAIAHALSSDSFKVLMLEGETGQFCRGMDIDALGHGAGGFSRGIERFAESLCLLAEADKPTLAVVSGPALGGGLGIAAACDVVIAGSTATVGLPEGLFGLTPAVITPVLLQRISGAQLRRLVLTAEPIGAEDARLLGLVDEVWDDAALPARARRLCTSLSRVHPATKGTLASVVGQQRRGSLRESVERGVTETTRAAESADVAGRIRRFLDGEAPWQS